MFSKKVLTIIFTAATAVVASICIQAPAEAAQVGQRAEGGDRAAEGGQRGVGVAPRGSVPATPQPPIAIRMVKPGLYMVTGGGGNSAVRLTKQGVILVDTKNLGDRFYNDLLAQIKTVTPEPVKYVFITHVHQDHSGNEGRFVEAGAQVIAHEGLKKNLETGGVDGKGYTSAAGKPAPPNVIYSKNKKIKLGEGKAEAYHFGRAHTSGDTIVYFPDLKTVSLGDMFVAGTPNCNYPVGGSLTEWGQTLNKVLKLDFDAAIPGHGDVPLTKKDVEAFRDKIAMIAKRAGDLAAKGTPKDQIRAQIQTPDLGWQMAQVVNDRDLDAFYAEVTAKSHKKSK